MKDKNVVVQKRKNLKKKLKRNSKGNSKKVTSMRKSTSKEGCQQKMKA